MVWFGMSGLAVLALLIALVFTKDSTLHRELCFKESFDKGDAMDTRFDELNPEEKMN
jgi:hypothetical protein